MNFWSLGGGKTPLAQTIGGPIMSDQKNRGLGDNSLNNIDNYKNPVDGIAYWKDVATEACRLMSWLLTRNKLIAFETNKAVQGKNNAVRGASLGRAEVEIYKVSQRLEPFDKIYTAIKNGEDVDSAPHKSTALDLVAKHGNLGCHIKNSNEKLKEVIDE
jgi:hypothetical protein|tara:strand:+ start:536 stop:1012 length:477 start_codon:yes stop_codon:yes gene_type:complete